MAAPAAMPKRTDLLSDQSRLKPTVMAATIASPAPTPLTARIGMAENRRLSCRCGKQCALGSERHHDGLGLPAVDDFVSGGQLL